MKEKNEGEVYTAYTSYEDKLWDVFTCCMISYFFLLLFSACESPVAMVIFVFCVGAWKYHHP